MKRFFSATMAVALVVMGVKAANVPASMTPPGDIPIHKAPLFVNIGWDDNTSSEGIEWAKKLFEHKNPDGTKTRSSFYLNSSGVEKWNSEDPETLAKAITTLNGSGHEIGNHTYDHHKALGLKFDSEKGLSSPAGWNKTMKFLRNEASQADWKKYINECGNALKTKAGVDLNEVKGYRTPYLEYGTNLFPALQALGFKYDCSIEESSDGNGNWNWPYTLDNGSVAHNNSWKSNEGNLVKIDGQDKPYHFQVPSVPGFWVMPAYALLIPDDAACAEYGIPTGLRARIRAKITWMKETDIHITGFDYNLWGKDAAGLNKAEVLGLLKYNLDLRIENNRAPFLFGAHSQYYVGDWAKEKAVVSKADMQATIAEFLAYARSKSMVRIVATSDIVNWMENPKEITSGGNNTDPKAPTDIFLSNKKVEEGTQTIGTLSTIDPNNGDTHTYDIVSGSEFRIDGDKLGAASKSGMPKGTHKVTIKTTDNTGKSFEKEFTVTVTEKAFEGVPVEVIELVGWGVQKDGLGSEATVGDAIPVVAKLTKVENQGEGEDTKYAWVKVGASLNKGTLEGVTHIEVAYSADKKLKLGLGTSKYGFVSENLPVGDNKTFKVAIADFTKSWGAGDLEPKDLNGVTFEAQEVGVTNLTITSLKLYGYVAKEENKDTLNLLTGGSWYKSLEEDVEGNEVVVKSGDNLAVTISRAAKAGTWASAGVWVKEGFTLKDVKRIEIEYSADTDFKLELPMKGVTDGNGAAHRILLPKGDNKKINVGILSSPQPKWAVGDEKFAATLKPELVEGPSLGLDNDAYDAIATGAITIKAIKLIYKGDAGQVSIKLTSPKAQTTPMINSVTASGIQLSVPTAGVYKVDLYSVDGRILRSFNNRLTDGPNSIRWNNANLGSRMVIVRITGNGFNSVSKAMLR